MLLPQTISSPCFGPGCDHSPTPSWLSYRNPSWGLASFGRLVFSFRSLFNSFIASVTHDFSTPASEQTAAPAPTAHRWWTLLPPWLAATPVMGDRPKMLFCATYFQLKELGRTRRNYRSPEQFLICLEAACGTGRIYLLCPDWAFCSEAPACDYRL